MSRPGRSQVCQGSRGLAKSSGMPCKWVVSRLPKRTSHPAISASGARKTDELPVRGPGLPFLIRLEGERIDEDRLAAQELHVCISGHILQRHAVLKGKVLEVERQQGGILQLAETPFVRIRDKRDVIRV